MFDLSIAQSFCVALSWRLKSAMCPYVGEMEIDQRIDFYQLSPLFRLHFRDHRDLLRALRQIFDVLKQ